MLKFDLNNGVIWNCYIDIKNKSSYIDLDVIVVGIASKLLLSFSIYTNAQKILDTSMTAGSLTAVNGIRFFSMSWVCLGHSLAFGLGFASKL